ncbi:MAG: HD domain-containing protein [Candidatus Nomurabacteria bacterium]|nr:HD domain-containing protein [Candidatus Nomurabacteria bacterium]
MRTISEIYEEYRLMKTLQLHMLRVASVASMICDSFDEPIDKEKIVKVCLLHDMGNIIKFQLDYFPEVNKPEGLEYWQNVQREFIEKYGDDEHNATMQIMRELGVSEELIQLADQNHFHLLCDHAKGNDMFVKIMHYADMRVGPFGVLSYEERMDEAKKRYANHKDKFKEEGRLELVECGREVERQIFAHCSIKTEDVNDESIKDTMERLKEFVI